MDTATRKRDNRLLRALGIADVLHDIHLVIMYIGLWAWVVMGFGAMLVICAVGIVTGSILFDLELSAHYGRVISLSCGVLVAILHFIIWLIQDKTDDAIRRLPYDEQHRIYDERHRRLVR